MPSAGPAHTGELALRGAHTHSSRSICSPRDVATDVLVEYREAKLKHSPQTHTSIHKHTEHISTHIGYIAMMRCPHGPWRITPCYGASTLAQRAERLYPLESIVFQRGPVQAHSVCPPGPRSVGGVVPRITGESDSLGSWRVRPGWPEGDIEPRVGGTISTTTTARILHFPRIKKSRRRRLAMGGKVWAGLAGRLSGAGRPRVGGRPRVEAGEGQAEAGGGQPQGEVNVC